MSYEAEAAFAADIAKQAGEIMKRYFRTDDIGTVWKGDHTPVTAADLEINKYVIDQVKEHFPTHGVLGEEESYESDRGALWVVDPVDGTQPFSLGIPISTFLLALVDREEGQPVLGITYDPFLEEMYTAVRGMGAFLNGHSLRTSATETLVDSYVAVYGPAVRTETLDYTSGKLIDALTAEQVHTFRMSSGAYTGAKIATGQFASIIMGNGKPWDSAAIAILVQEAGGVATDLEGNSRRYDTTELGSVISANQIIHEQILEIIKGKQ
jgi:myo-inositol-1(or 4)-monophosphatase